MKRRIHFFPMLIGALILGGCKVEKPPPQVSWIYPSSSPTITDGQAVLLRFRVEDPAPQRGSSEIGNWRVSIGPNSDATWWTASGKMSSAPSVAGVVDTIELTWQVGNSPSGGTEAVDLLLTAVATDGEGQTGADFGSATWAPLTLESAGLWWSGTSSGSGFSHAGAPNVESITEHSSTSTATHLVHLDGKNVLVTGHNGLQGWLLNDGIPSVHPEWNVSAPLSSAESGLLHLRRAPNTWTSSVWVQAGWADRCTWYDDTGQIQRTWLLETGETLLDARTIGDHMVILARTDAGEFRLIRLNLESGSRIDAITWTPEAAGSIGSDAKGWLIEQNGWAAAIESNGTQRIWNPGGGATPISTVELAGAGEVVQCGKWKDDQYWISRTETYFLAPDGSVAGTWPSQILSATLDRADHWLWVLTGNGTESQWTAIEVNGFSAIGEVLPAEPTVQSGSIAHNRPGPP